MNTEDESQCVTCCTVSFFFVSLFFLKGEEKRRDNKIAVQKILLHSLLYTIHSVLSLSNNRIKIQFVKGFYNVK